MAHLLFLPDDHTVILLDLPLLAHRLAASINNAVWTPPPAVAIPTGFSLKAVCIGQLVIVTLSQPSGQSISVADRATQSVLNGLSVRQNQILEYLIDGLTTQQISLLTGLHIRTIQYHISFIKSHLQAGTRAESIGRALGLGLFRGLYADPLKYRRRKKRRKPASD